MADTTAAATSRGPETKPGQETGRRIAQIVKLKPEFVDKYKEYHAAVWPDVLRQIKECNIRDCRLPLPPLFSIYV